MTSSNWASQASRVMAPSVADVYEYQTLRVRRSPAWAGSPGSTVASAVVPVTGTSSVSGWAVANASLGGGAACAVAGIATTASAVARIGSRRRMDIWRETYPRAQRRAPPARVATRLRGGLRDAGGGPHGLGQAPHALVDLLRRDPAVREPQAVLPALEQEVRALHEGDPALAGRREHR